MVFAMEYRMRVEEVEHHEHPRDGAGNDHYYDPLIYFWFDEEEVNKTKDENTDKPPWGEFKSEERNTIRDPNMGYAKTAHALSGTWDVWGAGSEFARGVRDDANRKKWRYFYWVDDTLRSRYHTEIDKDTKKIEYYEFVYENGIIVGRRIRKAKFPAEFGYEGVLKEHEDLFKILKVYLDELREIRDGHIDPESKGPANVIDFSDAKDLDLTDTEAVIKYCKEKWAKLKKELDDAYDELDDAVDLAQRGVDYYVEQLSTYAKALNTVTVQKTKDGWDYNERQMEQAKKRVAENASNATRVAPQVKASLEKCFELETEFCALMGSKTAENNRGKSIEESVPEITNSPRDDPKANPFGPGDDHNVWIDTDEWEWSKKEGWQRK